MFTSTNTSNWYFRTGNYPTAHVTVGKQRIKQYENNVVYLDNNQKFEIELFNPSSTKILAKININGNDISTSGIVVRPGERIFLQRFIDTNNSFVFETYTVDGNDDKSLEAIKNNGAIKVEFFNEYHQQIWYSYNSGIVFDSQFTTCSNTTLKSELETGMVGKGNETNQSFQYDYSQYEYFPFHNVQWKILPKSQQPITSEDLTKIYCHECGTKIKKPTYKFCPICGTKLN